VTDSNRPATVLLLNDNLPTKQIFAIAVCDVISNPSESAVSDDTNQNETQLLHSSAVLDEPLKLCTDPETEPF